MTRQHLVLPQSLQSKILTQAMYTPKQKECIYRIPRFAQTKRKFPLLSSTQGCRSNIKLQFVFQFHLISLKETTIYDFNSTNIFTGLKGKAHVTDLVNERVGTIDIPNELSKKCGGSITNIITCKIPNCKIQYFISEGYYSER